MPTRYDPAEPSSAGRIVDRLIDPLCRRPSTSISIVSALILALLAYQALVKGLVDPEQNDEPPAPSATSLTTEEPSSSEPASSQPVASQPTPTGPASSEATADESPEGDAPDEGTTSNPAASTDP